jgi:mevalonate kinase
MPRASAPGSVFLFGEHAVVYGRPALVASLDRVIEVSAELNGTEILNVKSELGELTAPVYSLPKTGKLRYVVEAVEKVFASVGRREGIDLEIKSHLPAASGLGTSSAVCVATIAAVSRAMGWRLSKDKIVELSLEAELEVQGLASRAGVSAATCGGFLLIKGKRVTEIKGPRLRAVIGWSGIPSHTARLLEEVQRKREERPGLIDLIFDVIGEITKQGVDSLEKGLLDRVGVLMNVNHALLSSLKIVPSRIERMAAVSRKAGAYGAKMTGAGGGGCMLALVEDESEKQVLEALRELGVEAFSARLGGRGLELA